eukprot:UN18945
MRDALYPTLACSYASLGDLKNLKELMKDSPGMFNAKDYDLRTPLHLACAEGNVECVEYLVTNGANVHSKDRWANTSLEEAVDHGHKKCIKLLLKAGANIGCTPRITQKMMEAVAKNDIEKLRMYRAAEANFDCSDYDDRTPIHIAVDEGLEEAVKFLVEEANDR